MKYQYITIENETGSGGTEIANIVANECGLPCFGAKEILQKVSQDYSFSTEQIKEYDNVTLLCTLAMREYKPYIKVFKAIRNDIVDNSKADNQDVTENIVEFGNEELPF